MHHVRFPVTAACLLLLASAFTIAQDADDQWPQYRGYRAAGLATDAPTPTQWDTESGRNVLWQVEIPGLAHAAPIVWKDRVYVATARGEGKAGLKIGLYGDIGAADDTGVQQWRLLAIDRQTGKIIFNELGHEGRPRIKRHTKSTHCNSTPATDGRHIVAILGSEGLFCFDMQGRVKWKKDLGAMDAGYFRAPAAQWGFGSSPVIHDGKVVVLCDVQKGSFLAAYDIADGEEIWETPREDVPTWGTPTIVEHDGRTQILVNGWRHTGAYDFKTGKEIWKLKGGGDIPVPTPVVAHGKAYFTNAHGSARPMRAVRLNATGDITPASIDQTNKAIAWVHARLGSYMQTPIVVGEHLYSCTGSGVLTCFDAATGEVQYRQRLGDSSAGGFTASPVSDGKHIYFTSETGQVFVVRAGESFALAARNDLGDNCLATPAIHNGALIFRTQHRLIAVANEGDKDSEQ